MDFLQFHNLSGGWEAFFAQEVRRVSQLEYTLPNGEKSFVTQVITTSGTVTLRETYEQVMEKLVKAWGWVEK